MRTRQWLVFALAIVGGLSVSARAVAAGGHLVGLGGGCLTVLGDGSADVTNLALRDCTDGDAAQIWTQPPVGSYAHVVGLAGKCLNASGGGNNDLILHRCQDLAENDRWTRTEGDSFELSVLWQGSRCADASDPERVAYNPCNGSAEQQWSFEGPPPPASGGVTTPSLPGFRFWTRINGERIATPVTLCTDETACLAGAIPSRAEIFVRIVGPKPNGYLWPNIVKFSTSATEIWIEQISSGQVKYYILPASNGSTLPGLVDRTGFLP